ncbi:hypothetical protein D9M71_338130 [compost metagenome]
MGARQHRYVGEFHRQFTDGVGDLAHQRQQYAVTAFAQHQGVGQVVDVFGGAGEVDELADLGQLRQLRGLFLEQVFHGLDVVVGGALDFLDALGMLQLEVFGQLVQQGIGFGGEGRDFRDAGMGCEALQPAYLYQDAETDEAVFAEDRTQGAGFAAIAAVNGGNRGKGGKLHGAFSWLKGQRKGRISYTKARRQAAANGPLTGDGGDERCQRCTARRLA